jgi:glutathione S-transferase
LLNQRGDAFWVSKSQAEYANELQSFSPGYGRTPEVDRDIERIVAIWMECRKQFSAKGNFLFGTFSIADAMYAPVVSRFITYDVALNGMAQDYVNTMMNLPSIKEWYGTAREESYSIPAFD